MLFIIVTRTTGQKVGINAFEVSTITPNAANTACDVRVGGAIVGNVVGSVENIVNQVNSIMKEFNQYYTPYSRRIMP